MWGRGLWKDWSTPQNARQIEGQQGKGCQIEKPLSSCWLLRSNIVCRVVKTAKKCRNNMRTKWSWCWWYLSLCSYAPFVSREHRVVLGVSQRAALQSRRRICRRKECVHSRCELFEKTTSCIWGAPNEKTGVVTVRMSPYIHSHHRPASSQKNTEMEIEKRLPYFVKSYCHILMTPSHPQVKRTDGSRGCHTQQIAGPLSCALYFCKILMRFQSHMKSLPLPSPLIKNCPSGLNPGSQAYPATWWPLNFFFFCMAKRFPAWKTQIVCETLTKIPNVSRYNKQNCKS